MNFLSVTVLVIALVQVISGATTAGGSSSSSSSSSATQAYNQTEATQQAAAFLQTVVDYINQNFGCQVTLDASTVSLNGLTLLANGSFWGNASATVNADGGPFNSHILVTGHVTDSNGNYVIESVNVRGDILNSFTFNIPVHYYSTHFDNLVSNGLTLGQLQTAIENVSGASWGWPFNCASFPMQYLQDKVINFFNNPTQVGPNSWLNVIKVQNAGLCYNVLVLYQPGVFSLAGLRFNVDCSPSQAPFF
jgi:hypothetical protein